MKTEKKEFTKYERARIIGARGLQIAMDAPLLLKMSKEELKTINYDPLKIAEKELDSGILPITVNQPIPPKREVPIEKIKIDTEVFTDEMKEKSERAETKEIEKDGEIMSMNEDEEEDLGFEEENIE